MADSRSMMTQIVTAMTTTKATVWNQLRPAAI